MTNTDPLPETMTIGRQCRVHILDGKRWYEAQGKTGQEIDDLLRDIFGNSLTISLAAWCKRHGISEAQRFRFLAKRRAAHQAV